MARTSAPNTLPFSKKLPFVTSETRHRFDGDRLEGPFLIKIRMKSTSEDFAFTLTYGKEISAWHRTLNLWVEMSSDLEPSF